MLQGKCLVKRRSAIGDMYAKESLTPYMFFDTREVCKKEKALAGFFRLRLMAVDFCVQIDNRSYPHGKAVPISENP